MRDKKVLAVDMDGVIADLTKKILKYYNTIWKDTLKVEDILEWKLNKSVKSEAERYVENLFLLDRFYRDVDPIIDSQYALKELSNHYDIVIVSDPYIKDIRVRNNIIKDKTEWLLEHFSFIPINNHIFTGNKNLIDADILIDDKLDNVKNFENGAKIGILFTQSYNSKTSEDIKRVENWKDALNKLI